MEKFSFGIDNDNLINLVLKGEKTATTSLYNKNNIPKKGDKSIILYDNGKEACKIETTDVIVTEFKNITEDLAYLEGEGDRSLDYYRRTHISFFKNINPEFNDNSLVVFEMFKVIKGDSYE